MSHLRFTIPLSSVTLLLLAGAVGCSSDQSDATSGAGASASDGGAGSGGSTDVGGSATGVGGAGGATASGGSGGGSTCAAPTGRGTEHGGSVDNDEVWSAADSPHLLPFDTSIKAKVTIEPCAVVRIGPAKTVKLAAGGHIEAYGLVDQPILIERLDAAAPWAAIRVEGGTMDLEHTRVVGGGDPLNAGTTPTAGAVMVRGQGVATVPDPTLRAVHVSIEDSASQGVVMTEFGAFSADSDDLTITGSAGYPINSWANLAGTIPAGSYTGNGVDQIVFPGNGQNETVHADMTLHDRGVPYRVGYPTSSGELRVGGGTTLATLTIEPNVELRFQKNGAVRIEVFTGDAPAMGALVAVGDQNDPIVFTSAETPPAPGDWAGIWFGLAPAPNSQIEHALIEYAGGPTASGSDSCIYPNEIPAVHAAGIRIFGPPASQFVKNTTISKSAAYGIDRGWRADEKIDFLATNDFVEVPKCKQTYPRDENGVCPSPVPCP